MTIVVFVNEASTAVLAILRAAKNVAYFRGVIPLSAHLETFGR